MRRFAFFLAVVCAALPVAAACNPAVNSRGFMTARGTVELADNVCPLSVAQKGELFPHHTYSPINFLAPAGTAGIWQATQDRTEGYGQGWEAYGSRFGAALANRQSSDFLKTFLLSAALRMDPRYFRRGTGSGGSRFGYAVSRVIVGRTDSGRAMFNAPQILGSIGSAGLSNLYYPEYDRTASRTFATAALNIAADAGWNVLKEFGPEIRGMFGGHKNGQKVSAPDVPKDAPKKDAGSYQNVPRP